MAKLILSALLRLRREGVEAKIAEFPDIKVSAWSIGVALARLREATWSRLRWTKVETSCAGEPISPVPEKIDEQRGRCANRGRLAQRAFISIQWRVHLRDRFGPRMVWNVPLADCEMSALGHKRTFGCGLAMSALPSTADMLRAAINVRNVPLADIGTPAVIRHPVVMIRWRSGSTLDSISTLL
jgi:hypothetical protein